MWLKWIVVSCGIVAFTVVGLTALDKHDERTCRQDPALAAWTGYDPPLPYSDGFVPVPAAPRPPTPALQPLSVPDICDGFLPW